MRFYKPGQTQYQSQFAPLNLDFMQKSLAQKEANDAIAEDLLDKTSQLQVEGGMLSDPNEVKKYNDWIQSNTAAIRDKFYSGELDAKEAARNLSKITQFYNTNEDIKFFNTDKQLSAATRARIAQGKANGALSSNISYLDGELSTTPLSSKAGLDALARGHNLTNPTGIYDKENYQHQMDKFVGNAVSNQFDLAPKEYNKLTGVPMIRMGDHTYTREELKAEKVKEWARDVWEQENRNNNTPFMQYQKQLYELNGDKYTQEQFIEDAANGFPGYYIRETTKDNSSFQQLPKGEKATKPTSGETTYAAAGTPTERGIKNATTFKSRMTSFLSSVPVVINPETGKTMSPEEVKQLKTYGLPVPKAENVTTANMSDDDKKLMSHYFKLKANQTGSKYFENLAADILKGKNVDFLKSDSFYSQLKKTKFTKKEFMDDITNPEFLSRMELVDVRNNNVVEDLNYNAEEVYKETGIRNSATTPANLEDFLASALATQSKIYDIEKGELIEPGKIKDRYKDMDATTRASTRVGVTLYRPENNFAVSIGDGNNWANAYQVNIGGTPFVVQTGRHQDPVRKQREYDYEMINKIFTTLTLGLPLEVLHWGKGDWIYDDSDKTKPPFYLETKSGTIKNSPAEVYQWGQENR